jgi:hypothetical protein
MMNTFSIRKYWSYAYPYMVIAKVGVYLLMSLIYLVLHDMISSRSGREDSVIYEKSNLVR